MSHSTVSVLLVESNTEICQLLKQLFAELGEANYQLEHLEPAADAIATLLEQRHDLYLIGSPLSQSDWLESIQTQLSARQNAAIVWLFAAPDPDAKSRVLTLGVTHYLDANELALAPLERALVCALNYSRALGALQSALESNNQLVLAIEHVQTGVVITDPQQQDNPMIFVNQAFTTITGYSAAEAIGKNCRFLQGPDTDSAIVQEIRQAVRSQQAYAGTLLNYRKDGTFFWNELTLTPVFNAAKELTQYIGLVSDVTAREQANQQRQQHEEALRESEERYALALQGANDGIWDWNLKSGEVYYSDRWKAMLGYAEFEIGGTLEEWFGRIHPEDLYWVKYEVTAHLDGVTSHFESEHRMLHRDGKYRWMLSRGMAVRDGDRRVTRMAGSQTDVTAWKQAEEKLLHDALHDRLTGLPNRVLLMERLRQVVQLTQRDHSFGFAVLFIDLDRFKVINDSLGHLIGDQLLVAISMRLATCLRPSDTIVRLGGDEFVILLENTESELSVTLTADRIQRELTIPFNIAGYEIFTGASIGIAFSSMGYQQAEDVLRDADIAMHRAKSQGRARHAIFHPGMHSRAVAQLQLETDLRRAVDRQEFFLCYQPIMSLRHQRLIGFEALVRWQHPQRGIVSPSEFIPVAEETGLIVPLGWWVLEEACRQMRVWQQQFYSPVPLTINVNLSSKQFSPQLIDCVSKILAKTQFPAQCLKLELTESMLMDNAEAAIATLSQLRQLGVQLAIDDFGTGYSSLSYLHRFPIDTLKIDRSFIDRVDVDGEQLAIVRTIITLAWNLGMEVVAEGVETRRQVTQLLALRCEYAQGYLFAPPLDAKAAEILIRDDLSQIVTKAIGHE